MKNITPEERKQKAEELLRYYSIPESEEDRFYIEGRIDSKADKCLLSYASLLCEETPEGNEHVDKLINTLMQNCDSENLERILHDYSSYAYDIKDESQIKSNTKKSGVAWNGFRDYYATYEPVPRIIERRVRVLSEIFRGIIRNPDIELLQMLNALHYRKGVSQQFVNTQFDILLDALQSGECKYTAEELMNGAKEYYGQTLDRCISVEELMEKLGAAEKRHQITPQDATKNALIAGITTNEVRNSEKIEKLNNLEKDNQNTKE